MLTDVALDDLVLVEATREQWLKAQSHQAAPYGQDDFIQQGYLALKRAMCLESEFAKKGRYVSWALVPQYDSTTLDFACVVDTYVRPIFIKTAEHPEGKQSELTCIASVFTPPGNRRRGYAQRMMVLLHEKLALIADISVLYSSIGNFYAGTKREHQNAAKAVGWNLVSPYHVTWQVGELLSREANTSDSSATKQEATKLEETDFDAALQIDADLLIEKVRKSPEASVFTIIPTQDQIDYALISCKFLDQLRFPPSRENFPHYDVFGCQIGRSGDRDWAFAIWRYGPVHNVLAILRLRCNNATQLRVILQTAGKAAAQQGISTITAWNVDEALLEGTGWSNVRRDNHLDALAWYGDGEQPKWLCNENWAHC